MKRKLLVVLAILAVTCWVGTASADLLDVTYNLTEFNVAGFTGPFVQVDVAIVSSTQATITETGLSNYFIHGTNAFGFNFTTNVGAVTVPSDVSSTAGSGQMDGFGNFNHIYDSTLPNYPGTQGPEVFLVAAASGHSFTSDISSLFITSGNFLCDRVGVNDGTSFITTGFADHATQSQVPIPPSALLLGSGLLGLVGFGWRRRKN